MVTDYKYERRAYRTQWLKYGRLFLGIPTLYVQILISVHFVKLFYYRILLYSVTINRDGGKFERFKQKSETNIFTFRFSIFLVILFKNYICFNHFHYIFIINTRVKIIIRK